MSVTVTMIRQAISERGFGIRTGTALFSDGLSARFHVLNPDPPAVRILGDEAMPEHERAVEAWLANQAGPAAA